MKTLNYWYCRCTAYSDAYSRVHRPRHSIIAKTQSEAMSARQQAGADEYSLPVQITFESLDAFYSFDWAHGVMADQHN